MFGSDYANHPEILTQSLLEMNTCYQEKSQLPKSKLLVLLMYIYVRIFGIPEIGFQTRGMYFRKALRTILNFKPKKILDIGSGIGAYVFYLARLFPFAQVEGWEIDLQKMLTANKLKKELDADNTQFTYGDITKNRLIDDRYELILIIDVLEHIDKYREALLHIYKLLQPHGYLYIHVPQTKQKRYFRQFRKWKHKDHIREGFNQQDIAAELKKIGYEIKIMDSTYGNFGRLAWEINHMLLMRSWIISGIAYPLLYLLSRMDLSIKKKSGLGISILARKKNLGS